MLQTAAGKRSKVEIYGTDYPTELCPDGTAVRDYIHVEDLARAHLLALESSKGAGLGEHRIYNLGNGGVLRAAGNRGGTAGHRTGDPRRRAPAAARRPADARSRERPHKRRARLEARATAASAHDLGRLGVDATLS
jgi:UDP-glucose 4-epimerase